MHCQKHYCRGHDDPMVYTGVRYFQDTKGIEAAGLYDKHP